MLVEEFDSLSIATVVLGQASEMSLSLAAPSLGRQYDGVEDDLDEDLDEDIDDDEDDDDLDEDDDFDDDDLDDDEDFDDDDLEYDEDLDDEYEDDEPARSTGVGRFD